MFNQFVCLDELSGVPSTILESEIDVDRFWARFASQMVVPEESVMKIFAAHHDPPFCDCGHHMQLVICKLTGDLFWVEEKF